MDTFITRTPQRWLFSQQRLRRAALIGSTAALMAVGSVLGSGFAPAETTTAAPAASSRAPGAARAVVMAALHDSTRANAAQQASSGSTATQPAARVVAPVAQPAPVVAAPAPVEQPAPAELPLTGVAEDATLLAWLLGGLGLLGVGVVTRSD